LEAQIDAYLESDDSDEDVGKDGKGLEINTNDEEMAIPKS
jgi:hypothetical protein